jgi:hypothetical protein
VTIIKDMEFFTHYCRAGVSIHEDYDTRRVEIQALIGTAPDSHTFIVYPYRAFETGYMNKGSARKVAARLKKEMKEFIKAHSIQLSEPIEISERFCS